MYVNVIAVGEKLPSWVNIAIDDYAKRIRGMFNIRITEIPVEKRCKTKSLEQVINAEGDRILQLIQPNTFVAALEVKGKPYTSETFAVEMQHLIGSGQDLAFIIGGPDGLSDACLKRANSHWSLSSFTLPHALARVVIVEQIYRAQTIITGHPYHK